MIKCISYWSMKDGLANTHPIADALATAKAEGFTGLELCIGTEGALSVKTTRKQCDAIRKDIDKSGVICETLAAGFAWGCNPTSDDAATRKKSVEMLSAALERASWLGLKALLYVPGVVKSPISTDIIRYDRAVERARENTKRLLEVAEKTGVELLVENVWNGLFYSPLELIEFHDSFKSKKFGVYFDAGNVLGYHQHPPHWIELLDKRIRRVHIKDFKQSIGSLHGFCDLMAGDVPWAETIGALRKIGYQSTVVAEMIPWDPAVLSRTSKALDKILAL